MAKVSDRAPVVVDWEDDCTITVEYTQANGERVCAVFTHEMWVNPPQELMGEFEEAQERAYSSIMGPDKVTRKAKPRPQPKRR